MTPSQFLFADTPLLDVRSPLEYRQGHIPGAVSFPLFTDEERAQVGTTYKQEGKSEAVRLGLKIVGPKLFSFAEDADRLAGGSKALRIYCWRGGMRSGSMAWLLTTAGYRCHVLQGGYKAFRRWGAEQFERTYSLIVLGGLTGSGKTERLETLRRDQEQTIDLEALANHRGSSFGHIGYAPQPTCEHFTNKLAMELSRCDPKKRLWIEDESRMIGACQIPHPFWSQMCAAKMVWIEASKEARVARLMCDYGDYSIERLVESVRRLEKKLGGQKTKYVCECIESGRMEEAIRLVLDYYDQTYAFACTKRQRERISFPAFHCNNQTDSIACL